MKNTLSTLAEVLATLAAVLALGLPAQAETLANGTPVQQISSSIIVLGDAPAVVEPEAAPAIKRVEAAKTVASMSLDEIIGARPVVMNDRGEVVTGKETETAEAPVSKDNVQPVTADASAPAPAANNGEDVVVMRPRATDNEATASISSKPPVENQGEVKPSEDQPKDVREEMRPAQ